MFLLLGVLCFMIEDLVNRGLSQKAKIKYQKSISKFKNQNNPLQNTNFQNKHGNAYFENLQMQFIAKKQF